MNKTILSLLLSVSILLLSCDSETKKIPSKGEFIEQITNKDGSIIQKKYVDGQIQNEFTYVNNKKHGTALVYYPGGKLHTKSTYVNGKIEGEAFWYYESGKVFDVRIYKDNKMQGIRKSYYESGKLKSEQEYKDNMPQMGLKEYGINGELIEQPKLILTTKNKVVYENKFLIICNMSDDSKKVSYSQVINKGKNGEYRISVKETSGVGELSLIVNRGDYLMEDVTIRAEKTTTFNNPLILEKTIRVAAENR